MTKRITYQFLKDWALNQNHNPAWIELYATYDELLSEYNESLNKA